MLMEAFLTPHVRGKEINAKASKGLHFGDIELRLQDLQKSNFKPH
jgi:hypothetical protein